MSNFVILKQARWNKEKIISKTNTEQWRLACSLPHTQQKWDAQVKFSGIFFHTLYPSKTLMFSCDLFFVNMNAALDQQSQAQ